MSRKVVYTPATPMERRALQWLGTWVRFPPATASKRFAREMMGATELTDKQRAFLWRIVYRFRRQVHPEIVAEAERFKAWADSYGRGAATDAQTNAGIPTASPQRDVGFKPDTEGPPREDEASLPLFAAEPIG